MTERPPTRAMAALILGMAVAAVVPGPAEAQGDARTAQLRLLCSQLSGDLTEPGGIAAFRRCLNRPPVAAMRQNLNVQAGRTPDGRRRAANPYPPGYLVNPSGQPLVR